MFEQDPVVFGDFYKLQAMPEFAWKQSNFEVRIIAAFRNSLRSKLIILAPHSNCIRVIAASSERGTICEVNKVARLHPALNVPS